MTRQKFKHKYLRSFIKENKIKDPKIKSALYGAMFDIPKKVEKGITLAKNKNHREYLEKMFLKIAIIGRSNNIINYLNLYKG